MVVWKFQVQFGSSTLEKPMKVFNSTRNIALIYEMISKNGSDFEYFGNILHLEV